MLWLFDRPSRRESVREGCGYGASRAAAKCRGPVRLRLGVIARSRPGGSFPQRTPKCPAIAALGSRSLVRRVLWSPYPRRRGPGASSRQTLGGGRESGLRVYSGVAARGPPFRSSQPLGKALASRKTQWLPPRPTPAPPSVSGNGTNLPFEREVRGVPRRYG